MTRSTCTLLALFLLASAPSFAQTGVAGDWDVTVNSPQGSNTTLVTFTQDGEKVAGIFKSPLGQLPFDGGKLTGSDLTFTFTITTQGMQLPITLTGKVEGATMAGKADFGGFAEGDWTAKRTGGTSTATTTTKSTTTTTTTTVSTTTSSGMGVAGKWDVMIKTPGGDVPASATLTEAAGTLTGTFGSQMGEVAVAGSMEGKAVKLSFTAQTPQGDLAVVMTGDLEGDSIVNGKAEIAGMGQMEWSATRAKQ